MLTQKLVKTAFATCLLSLGLIGCTSTLHQESTGQYIDSAAITAKVKADLLADKKVKSLPITVNTYKRTVQLSGFVNSTYQKERAVEIARHVPGVDGIEDSLIVRPR